MSVYKKLLVLGVCAAVLTAPMQAAAANVGGAGLERMLSQNQNIEAVSVDDYKKDIKKDIEDYFNDKVKILDNALKNKQIDQATYDKTRAALEKEKKDACDKVDSRRSTQSIDNIFSSAKSNMDGIIDKMSASSGSKDEKKPDTGTGRISDTDSAKKAINDYAAVILQDTYSADDVREIQKYALEEIDNRKDKWTPAGLEEFVNKTKSRMEKYDNSNAPADDKEPTLPAPTDYVQVGGNWVTPVATYSQRVNVVLPIVNMAKEDATDVIVTPVLDTDPENWPFDIEQSSYTVKLDRLAGENVNGDAMERRQEITWNFRTRKDVTSGYKKIAFNVQYTNSAGEKVNTTLNTYVKAVGAPGSGTGDTTSTPRLIVTGFDTDPEQVRAGDNFTLTVHMKNTAKRTAVSNVEFTLKAATEGKDADAVYEAFLPVAGSSTIYVESIPAGGTTDLVIDMKAKADLAQKPYVLNIDMKYEDEKLKEFTASSSVSIPVYQEARYEISEPEVMPSSIDVGSESNVMFSIYNTGKTTLYNVSVRFEGDSVSGGEAFVGNIQSGGTGNVDTMLTGVAPTTDDGIIKAIISFEDNETNKTEVEKELTLYVSEPVYDDMDMNDFDMSDDTKSGFPIWAKILLVLVVIAAVVAAVIIVKKKKKARAASLLEDELADSIGDDAKENKGE
ncbi:hypothetical protein RJD28_05675 [Oscillospiraceae bacterium NTUH-002-81]|nr:hypothetical protein RJD28_05675 [Oscillospiraceae bacterium NTUH-002-81]